MVNAFASSEAVLPLHHPSFLLFPTQKKKIRKHCSTQKKKKYVSLGVPHSRSDTDDLCENHTLIENETDDMFRRRIVRLYLLNQPSNEH